MRDDGLLFAYHQASELGARALKKWVVGAISRRQSDEKDAKRVGWSYRGVGVK